MNDSLNHWFTRFVQTIDSFSNEVNGSLWVDLWIIDSLDSFKRLIHMRSYLWTVFILTGLGAGPVRYFLITRLMCYFQVWTPISETEVRVEEMEVKGQRYFKGGQEKGQKRPAQDASADGGTKRRRLDATSVSYFRRVSDRLNEGFTEDEERGDEITATISCSPVLDHKYCTN